MNKKNNYCVAFIFARGGSKGIPEKNIRKLCGIPLIAHSIKVAKNSPTIDKVIVSTDSKKIANISEKYGAEVPFIRPKKLAKDSSSELEAWKHAIKMYQEIYNKKIETFVSLPPTSPLRSVEDIENCIKEFKKNKSDIIITVKKSSHNPYFNMIKNNKAGFSEILNSPKNGKLYHRRQDAPQTYDMTTVAYVSNPRFILETNSIFSGNVKSVIIPQLRAIDIDNIIDFEFAEFIMNKKEQL